MLLAEGEDVFIGPTRGDGTTYPYALVCGEDVALGIAHVVGLFPFVVSVDFGAVSRFGQFRNPVSHRVIGEFKVG